MTRLTIFYFLNWLALMIYIINASIYLSHEEMGLFQVLMVINTPLFLIIVIKAFTKGISKLFKSGEYEFRYLAGFLVVFTYIFSGIDAKVLAIYRDHFNIKLFGILFETGVMKDLGVQSSDIFSLLLQIIGICVWVWISFIASKWVFETKREIFPQFISHNIQIVLKILIYLSLTEKLFFSYFHYTDREKINGYWNSIPSYTVLRMSKVWRPIINAPTEAEREAAKITWDFENDFLTAQEKFKSNLANVTAEKTNVNIVFLVFESLRSDMNTPEIMPNLSQLRTKWISSDQHFSNSNCTGNGTFGILTGMTPFYWYPSYKQEFQPAAISILDQLGYAIDIYTTTTLGYSDMDKHIFTDAVDHVYEFTGYGGGLGHPMVKRSDLYKWDELMVDEFLTNFKNRDSSTPSMSYLWFYSTHYNYYFPESFGKFKPYIERHYQIYERELQKESHLVFNRYKNSAYYADHLIGKITDEIKKSGQSENTIIVVLGDHGEEFNEFGRFAHSYSFKNVQSSTPFVMHIPGYSKSNYKVTSHADIMPSIMDYIGVSLPSGQLFSGKSLLNYNENLDFAIVQECEIKNRPKKFLIANSEWKMEFTLTKGKIEAGNLETILDEPVSSNVDVDYAHIKKELLIKAQKNLGHYSNSN
ncbi:MAG: sulfatase [Candidatus Marinimicrobia bacterium]|nr:sulfatase [Candidatus Neomarinimicrobiota bacterium]MBL7009632.1 sulfatase [Candidatus Neomarinimicrobiota bacterium]MBL7029625.1 sulfatase [Candidatus Neomarinimicrobiota bacterium]